MAGFEVSTSALTGRNQLQWAIFGANNRCRRGLSTMVSLRRSMLSNH